MLYFIKENKARCAVLILMIFLSFGVYLAGLYVMNVVTSFEEFGAELYESSAFIGMRARDKVSMQGYEDAAEDVRNEENVQLLELGWGNYFNIESDAHSVPVRVCVGENADILCLVQFGNDGLKHLKALLKSR